MTEARGGRNLQFSEFQVIMQKWEQMEQGKQALEEIVGAVQRDVVKTKKENKSYVNTWENNGKPENQDPIARLTAMLEKPKLAYANQKSKDFLDARVISRDANEDPYEKLGRFETALKKRILAFIEKALKYARNHKEMFSCKGEKLEDHLSNHDWETIPNDAMKGMLLSCTTCGARQEYCCSLQDLD